MILNFTAGIGPVYLVRWLWWRINPWSEIAAMIASVPVLAMRSTALAWLGLPSGLLPELLFMVLATALIWLPVTLLTPPADRATLSKIYAMVRPPGWWKPVRVAGTPRESWGLSLLQWVVGTIALLSTTIGALSLLVGQAALGWGCCGLAVIGWGVIVVTIRATKESTS